MYKSRQPKPCPICNRHFPKAQPQEVYCSLDCAIWPRIQKGDPDKCWPWQGGLARGYPAGTFQKRRYKVSRYVLAQKLGRELSAQEQALHSCDNPRCCNPSHLFAGTGADNMRDKVEKGRARGGIPDFHGERHPLARLSRKEVEYIWEHRHTKTPTEMARQFNANRSMIWKVMNGVTWASVTSNLP